MSFQIQKTKLDNFEKSEKLIFATKKGVFDQCANPFKNLPMLGAKNAQNTGTSYKNATNTGYSPNYSLTMVLFHPNFSEYSFAATSVGDIAKIFPL